MKEVCLKYRGKKNGLVISRAIGVSKDIHIDSAAVWVSACDAEIIFRINPKMFLKVAEREAGEVIEEVVPDEQTQLVKDEPREPFGICDKCGKEFMVEWTFKRHIEKCTGEK